MMLRRRGLALLVLAWAFVACGSGSDGLADAERRIPVSGLLVFTVGVDLWIQDDQGARPLIQAGQDQQLLQPAISPDGERVAYVVFQLTNAEGTSIGTDLAVASLDDPQQEIVVRHTRQAEFVWSPRWTPDGQSLIFTHEPGELTIRVVRLDLQRREAEVVREDARDADVSPDGARIVFVNTPYSGDPHLVVRNLSDGSETVLDPEREWPPMPVRLPRFAPDGESVVFSGGQFLPQVSARVMGLNGPEDIWSYQLTTGVLTQLAAIGEDQPDFAISDDGRHVLIMGAFGMYLVEAVPRDPPYAIAPGEFHGGIDWTGNISDHEWQTIRESVFELPDGAQ
ncbi:MAG: LpqB family beta-propeller domain-containing protein [Chloroflexota bacterium]|nr:LpqB family beta-propeller domain-containing protein [Chloroflexota bacterium]